MANTRLAVKLQLGEDIRRVQLEAATFEQLQRVVREVYPGVQTFTLKYKDEEDDYITISCDSELVEAFKCSAIPLRIAVFSVDKPAPPTSAIPTGNDVLLASSGFITPPQPRSRSTSAEPPAPTSTTSAPSSLNSSVNLSTAPSTSASQSPFDLSSFLQAFAAPVQQPQQQTQQPQQNPLASLLPLMGLLQGQDMDPQTLMALAPLVIQFAQRNPQAINLAMQLFSSVCQPPQQQQQQPQQAPPLEALLSGVLQGFAQPPAQQQQQQQQPQQPPPIFQLASQFLANLQQPQPSQPAGSGATVKLPEPYASMPPIPPTPEGATVDLPPVNDVPVVTPPTTTATTAPTPTPTPTPEPAPLKLSLPSQYATTTATLPTASSTVHLPPFDDDDTPKQTPAVAIPTTTAAPSRWATELEQLSAMGFTNVAENERLLNIHDGDLSMVVQCLTATSEFFMP